VSKQAFVFHDAIDEVKAIMATGQSKHVPVPFIFVLRYEKRFKKSVFETHTHTDALTELFASDDEE
jgi:hypothetical protein